jgi:hypothetical protein
MSTDQGNDLTEFIKSWREQALAQRETATAQGKPTHSLEYDMHLTPWFVGKVRASKCYAQNLYAAMCNMQWQEQDVMPILKNELWSCTWRSAGGIVADLEGQGGDYMDWYCSGIGDETPDTNRWHDRPKKYVREGTVTDEIREDLAKIGWIPVEWEEDND